MEKLKANILKMEEMLNLLDFLFEEITKVYRIDADK